MAILIRSDDARTMPSKAHWLLAVTLAACSSATPSASTPAPATAPAAVAARTTTTLYQRIPEKVASYSLTERAVVRGLPTDSIYRYKNGTNTNVTVFIYDPPPEVRVGADSQKWTMREGEKFKQVMEVRRQRGDFRDYTVAFSDTVTQDFGGPRLLEHSIATPVRSNTGAIAIEFQLLYLIEGKFLKVRATVPFEGWQQTTVMSFARALAGVVARGGS